jgi:hypothetical protein
MNPHDFARHARALRAISDALDIRPEQVPALLQELWAAWEAHPFFEEYYAGGWSGKLDAGPIEPRLYAPVALAVFTHEVGLRGHPESYVVSTLPDLIASIRWGERTLGDFAGVIPVPDDFPSDLIGSCRQVVISHSPKGAGNAYECRMELKRLLPRKLHRWIVLARRVNSKPKWQFLPMPPPGVGREDKSWWPDWYKDNTKGQLFLYHDAPYRSLTDEARAQIRDYTSLESFWKAATGRVRAVEVRDLVTHQLELGLDLESE